MREDFEEKSSPSKRYAEEDAYSEEPSVEIPLSQSLETLRQNYSWINHFHGQHPGYPFRQYPDIPWSDFEGGLLDARVALVSTAGVFAKGQKPFSISPEEVTNELQRYRFKEKGDPSFRVIPNLIDHQKLWIAHPYLDVRGAEADINVVFPVNRLQELEEESFIGAVADHHLSFMGYLPNPNDIEEYVDEAIAQLKGDQVNVVVLTAGEVLSHQSMVVLQRAIESSGIATVSIGLCRDVIEYVGAPRAVHYRFPFGFTLGDVNDAALQLRILKDALRLIEDADQPGATVELPYEWVEA
ncbi:MAG: glycine/sarcosine/betaine reductase selenoprotein B family protein [Acidobacteriota bacterium]